MLVSKYESKHFLSTLNKTSSGLTIKQQPKLQTTTPFTSSLRVLISFYMLHGTSWSWDKTKDWMEMIIILIMKVIESELMLTKHEKISNFLINTSPCFCVVCQFLVCPCVKLSIVAVWISCSLFLYVHLIRYHKALVACD